MGDTVLFRLMSKPITIRENDVSGHLFVDGNIEGNRLLFRFLFDNPDEVAPVFMETRIAGQRFRYLLAGRDITNPMVKSPVLFPEATLAEGIEILCVKPFISAI